MADSITLEKRGKVAIVKIDRPKKLNSLDTNGYFRIATLLNEIAEMPDITVTVLTATGHFFSAGADTGLAAGEIQGDVRMHWARFFVSNNLYVTRSFYTHPKILVTAMNGPAVGLSAAIIAFSDFIYCAPHAFLLTPFSSLGLVAEGGVSVTFVQRMGIAKANEALIMSKRIPADELLQCGFVNKIIDGGDKNDSKKFLKQVLAEVDERLGDHLNSDSMIKIKALIREPQKKVLDSQGVDEVFGGLDRFLSGVPQEEFRKVASGEKKHKL